MSVATSTTVPVAPAPVAGCVTSLGSLGDRRLTRPGSWSASQGCLSSRRGDSQTRYFAKRFTFTLTVDTNIVIALSSARDSYLYVLNGHGAAGTLRAQNDDADSNTRDSRIETRLDSGAYTIEAITRQARTRGSFTLTVTTSTPTPTPTPVTPIVVTFSGLSKRYTASVGNPVRVAFSYQPATAQMSLQQPTLAGLTLTASHPTCPTDANNPFDPLNPTHPWLPFTTDECSIPQKLIQGIEP
ncbi:MAG: pre-peptidase C-terminal domain-containing protein [Acidimicrobiaceae bacterium]|nr:pre-peptidase C-terminal domain-containing protein [Acidimicrobiaceae bacterium]